MDAKEAASTKKKAELAQAGRKKLEEFRKKKAAAAAAPKGPSGAVSQRLPPTPVAGSSAAPVRKDVLAPPPAATSSTTAAVPGPTRSPTAPSLAFASKGPLVSVTGAPAPSQNALSSATGRVQGPLAVSTKHAPPAAPHHDLQPQHVQPSDVLLGAPQGVDAEGSAEPLPVPTGAVQASEAPQRLTPPAPPPAPVAMLPAPGPRTTPPPSGSGPVPPVLSSMPPAQAQDLCVPAFLPPPPTGLAFAAPPVFKGSRSRGERAVPRPSWLPSAAVPGAQVPEWVRGASHSTPDAGQGTPPEAAGGALGGSSGSTSRLAGPGVPPTGLPPASHAVAPGPAPMPTARGKEEAAVPASDLGRQALEGSVAPLESTSISASVRLPEGTPMTEASAGDSSHPMPSPSDRASWSQEPGVGLASGGEGADGLRGTSLAMEGDEHGSSAPRSMAVHLTAGSPLFDADTPLPSSSVTLSASSAVPASSRPTSAGIPPALSSSQSLLEGPGAVPSQMSEAPAPLLGDRTSGPASQSQDAALEKAGDGHGLREGLSGPGPQGGGSCSRGESSSSTGVSTDESFQDKGVVELDPEQHDIHGQARAGRDAVLGESNATEPGGVHAPGAGSSGPPPPPFCPPSSSTLPASSSADPLPVSDLLLDALAEPSHPTGLGSARDAAHAGSAAHEALAQAPEGGSARGPSEPQGAQGSLSAAPKPSQGPRRGFFSRAFAVLAPLPEAEGRAPPKGPSPSLEQGKPSQSPQQAQVPPPAQQQALEGGAGSASQGMAGLSQAASGELKGGGHEAAEGGSLGPSVPGGNATRDVLAPAWPEASGAARGGSAGALGASAANPPMDSPAPGSVGPSLGLANSMGAHGLDTGAIPAGRALETPGPSITGSQDVAPAARPQSSGLNEPFTAARGQQQTSLQRNDGAALPISGSSPVTLESGSGPAPSVRAPSAAAAQKSTPFYRPSWLSFQRKPQAGESSPQASAREGQGERPPEGDARGEAQGQSSSRGREGASTLTGPEGVPRAGSGEEQADQRPSKREAWQQPEEAPMELSGRIGSGAMGEPGSGPAPVSAATSTLADKHPGALPFQPLPEGRGSSLHRGALPLQPLPSGSGREEPSGLLPGLGVGSRLPNGSGRGEAPGQGVGHNKGSLGVPLAVPAPGPALPQAKRELFASPSPSGSSSAASNPSSSNTSSTTMPRPSTDSLSSGAWASSLPRPVAGNSGFAANGVLVDGHIKVNPFTEPLARNSPSLDTWAPGSEATGVAAMKPPLPAVPTDRATQPSASAQGGSGAASRDPWEPASAAAALVPEAGESRRHSAKGVSPTKAVPRLPPGLASFHRDAAGVPPPSRALPASVGLPSSSPASAGPPLQRSASGRSSAGAGAGAGSPSLGYAGEKKFPGLPVLGPMEAAKDTPTKKVTPARGGHAALASADFSALEQHIEDLTLEKFTLERALASAHLVAESLARENSALTEDFNSQGKALEQMEEEMGRLKAEIAAQQMVMESQRMEKLAAHHEVLAAVERSQTLASEVVALEEKSLRLRSSELKLEREVERLTDEAAAHRRSLEQLEKERAALRGNVQALQEEKKQLKVQLRRAAVGGALRDVRDQTGADTPPRLLSSSTSTDDLPAPGNDVGEHARDGRREVAPPPVGAAGQQAREGPGGAPQAGRAHPEASAAAPESQEVLLSPEVASALERVKALLLAVQGRASSVERVVQTLAEAISVSAQAPALSSPAGSAEDGPQLLELLSLPALLPESVDILLVEDQSTLASIDSMLTELKAESQALAAALESETESSNALRAANKELSAKLASQTQRMELLVSQSMLAAAAAAAAGTAQGIPDAESPLVKAVSSSQGEGEQAQQLMLLRSPSRNVAAMASPGSGRLANETGQLEYLDEGDEVAEEMVSWLLRFLPGKAEAAQAGA